MSRKTKSPPHRHVDRYNAPASNHLKHREHFNEAGHVKKAYDRRTAILRAYERQAANPGLRAYECGLCGCWHLGKSRPRQV